MIKKVSLWKFNDKNFIADQSHLSLLPRTEPFKVYDLSSFAVIKEHVVQAQMVWPYSGLYKSSDFFNHHKDLTSSEICDGAIFHFAGYSSAFIWNKKPIFVFDIHDCINESQDVSNEKGFLLEFCSIGAVIELFVKFFKDKSKSTLQYNIWYIKTEPSEADIQVGSISVNPKKSSTTGKSISRIIICFRILPSRKFKVWRNSRHSMHK